MDHVKEVKSVRRYKVGYETRVEVIDGEWCGGKDFEMRSAYTPSGDYIGNKKTAHFLCSKRGIAPEKRTPDSNVCSIGFSATDGRWYGWSHRAICGFGVGDTVSRGDCTEEYLPLGYTATTTDECREMAAAFARSVS